MKFKIFTHKMIILVKINFLKKKKNGDRFIFMAYARDTKSTIGITLKI